jgi:DNA-directed RNA polymerase subunit M/transcription elongation factor TFIIS
MSFDGEGSTQRLEPTTRCPKCHTLGVHYTGSSVLHGNPYTPAADTEIEHHYACPRCQHRWSSYA